MFKYFFPCPKQELTINGEMDLLDLKALGDAAVAMQDCTKVGHQCMLSEIGIHSHLGPGAILDPFPIEGERPSFGYPGQNGDWAWLAFPWRGKEAYIGFNTKSPPTPHSLRRRELIHGYFAEDTHGRKWAIPVARDRSSVYGKLPTFVTLEADDSWGRRLDSRHQWLWELSKEVWECLECFYDRSNRPEFAFPWLINQIVKVLGVNYRIGKPELRAFDAMNLCILSDDFCNTAAEMLVDMQAIENFAKRKAEGETDQKKTSATLLTNSPDSTGEKDSSSTSPALANCG